MARQTKTARQEKAQTTVHQRNLRRNQFVFIILSGIIIISMVLSLLINL